MANKQSDSRFPLPVRILAIVMAVLVTGGALTYLGLFFAGLIH